MIENKDYILITPKNYSKESNCFEVVFIDKFIPFDIIKGIDGCPNDNWWVCPKTYKDVCNVHDISVFISSIPTKDFKKLEDAISFSVKWTNEFLKKQIDILRTF